MLLLLLISSLAEGFQNPYNLDIFSDIFLEIGKNTTLEITASQLGPWELLVPKRKIWIQDPLGELISNKQYFLIRCDFCDVEEEIPYALFTEGLNDNQRDQKFGIFTAINYTINY